MSPLPRLQLHYVDNNGNVSRPGWHMPAGALPVDVLAWANTLASVVAPLTMSSLTQATLRYDLAIEPGPPAEESSDSRLLLTLFYSTGANYGWISIPSPRQLGFDLAGAWRGFRLTRESAESLGVLNDIEALVTGTVNRAGGAFPNEFAVGALEQTVF